MKDSKDSLDFILDLESRATSDTPHDVSVRAKTKELREAVQRKEARALAELENQFRVKEQEVDRRVAERQMAIESERLQWLKREQLREKSEVLEKYLPVDSVVRDWAQEMMREEEKELEEFKREMEVERARKMEELRKQEEALRKEMEEQKARLDKAAQENKRLLEEDQRRER